MSFSSLIDEVQALPIEEKFELKHLLDKYLIEERRNEIQKNYIESKNESASGKIKTYRTSKSLRESLESD